MPLPEVHNAGPQQKHDKLVAVSFFFVMFFFFLDSMPKVESIEKSTEWANLQCSIKNIQPPTVIRPPDGGKPHQLWAVEDRRSRLLVHAGPFPCIGLDFWIPALPNYRV